MENIDFTPHDPLKQFNLSSYNGVILRYIKNSLSKEMDFKRHGPPNTPREWSLEHNENKVHGVRECSNCSAVYGITTVLCEQCGWDMRIVECENCSEKQQYGFGECSICEGELVFASKSRRERKVIDGELQEIKSFEFRRGNKGATVFE